MENQTNNKNKDWERRFREENKDTFIEIGLSISQIIDKKMIDFINKLLKSQKEEIIKKIEKNQKETGLLEQLTVNIIIDLIKDI